MAKLLYVGQQVADDLRDRVAENITRYREGDFLDLEVAGDWRIPLSIDVDLDQLNQLVPGNRPQDEIQNSAIVGRALSKVTPTLARENRVWIRLSHIECLEYARNRWLPVHASDAELAQKVCVHMFAPTRTRCRDDHAVGRLWWNYQVARQIMPEEPERALKVILARADLRLNLVERPGVGARPQLARGIVRTLEISKELLTGELLFREFMKNVNLLGAGIAFEVWPDNGIDEFMARCLEDASKRA